MALAVVLTHVNPICGNGCTGRITATASGGTAPFTYYLYGDAAGTLLLATSPLTSAPFTFFNLCPGNYWVRVMDAEETMTALAPQTISPGAVVGISWVVVNPTFFGASNGSIQLIGSLGSGSYLYSIDGGATFHSFNTFNSLPAGVYQVAIEDNVTKCIVNSVLTLTSPAPPPPFTVRTSVTPSINCAGANAVATVFPIGDGPFSYYWTGGTISGSAATLDHITGVAGTTYHCTITQISSGYAITVTITIPVVSNALTLQLNAINPTTLNPTGGVIQAIGSGGSGMYSYSWVSGENTPVITGLEEGSYAVTLTDLVTTCSISGFVELFNQEVTAPDDCTKRLHNTRCCIVKLFAKAAILKRIGDTQAQCTYEKALMLKNLLWAVTNDNSCNTENCLTPDEEEAIWKVIDYHCSPCNC